MQKSFFYARLTFKLVLFKNTIYDITATADKNTSHILEVIEAKEVLT